MPINDVCHDVCRYLEINHEKRSMSKCNIYVRPLTGGGAAGGVAEYEQV